MSALTKTNRRLPRAIEFKTGGPSGNLVIAHPESRFATSHSILWQRASETHAITFFDFTVRMGEFVQQGSICRQNQQTRSLSIESTDHPEAHRRPFGRKQTVNNGGFPNIVTAGHTDRLMENEVKNIGSSFDGFPVEINRSTS